jgi:hypothetical protein
VKNKYFFVFVIFTVLIVLSFAIGSVNQAAGTSSSEVIAARIPESEDFATLILRDPWDMEQFSDISQYLNESGQRDIIRNPAVRNGIFSGTAVTDISKGANGNFFPLFPGYETAMLIGKVGHRYPIDANLYQCLYIAMKVDSPPVGFVPDRYRVFFFADERLNTAGSGNYGSTYPIRLFEPDASPPPGVHIWKVHKVDLSNPPEGFAPGTATWNDKPYWQGLRIDPTMNANTDFAVDWVRLTKCQSNMHTITWNPNSTLTTMWLRPVGTNRQIRVATDVVGQRGSYQLDVQGIAPGRYVVGLSNSLSDCCIAESDEILEINQTPIANFANPNFYSGPDYATMAGNPWDFLDSADVVKLAGVQGNLVDGVLDLVTIKSNGADPKVYLNTPQLIPNSKEFRYFTFRMYTEGPWQNVPDGMILRWIWVQLNNRGDECYRVSHDIPYDVGWQIYSIDMHDAFNGIAEEVAGSCSGQSWHWLDSSPISKFRLDPNENILGVPLHQQIDWVRLTQVESVQQGSQFTIRIGLNKNPSEISKVEFFYTDDPISPTKHPASELSSFSNLQNLHGDQGPNTAYQSSEIGQTALLPFVVRNFFTSDLPGVANEIRFNWDTSSVPPGEYYICARVNDGFNEAIYCSEAAVVVAAN